MTVPKHWKGVGVPTACEKHKLSVAWWYGWSANVAASRVATYIPMDWDGEGVYGDIVDTVATRPAGSYYLIYNEPDDPGQANHAPDRAADNYFDLYRAIKAIDETAKVGGIGLTWIAGDGHCDEGPSLPRPAGKDYLVEFLEQLKLRNDAIEEDVKFDFYHVHAYHELYWPGTGWVVAGGAANTAGTSINFERLQKHLIWLHGTLRSSYDTEIPANMPIWITETSWLNGDGDDNGDFMGILCSWLDSWGFDTGLIERVAWFSTRYVAGGFDGTDLFESDLSTLTNLGKDWLDKEDNEMFTPLYNGITLCADNGKATGAYELDVWTHLPGVKAVFLNLTARWATAAANKAMYCMTDANAQNWCPTVRGKQGGYYQDNHGTLKVDDDGCIRLVIAGGATNFTRVRIYGYWE